MIVVTKTLEAKAGSIFNFFRETGTSIPNNPATIMFKIIDTPINNERFNCLNHNCTITAVIIAKIIPFKIPIRNSLPTTRLKLLFDNSFVVAIFYLSFFAHCKETQSTGNKGIANA